MHSISKFITFFFGIYIYEFFVRDMKCKHNTKVEIFGSNKSDFQSKNLPIKDLQTTSQK